MPRESAMSVILQFRDTRGPQRQVRARAHATVPGGLAEVVIFPGIRIERDRSANARGRAAPDPCARGEPNKPRSLGGADD